MKIKVILLSLLSSVMVSGAFAQVEQDDMYFNSKDRAKLRETQQASENAMASARKKEKAEEDYNQMDSYSARNVNPEFTSRSQSKTSQEDEEDYFVSNYRLDQNSNYNNFNNNFNNWYNNPWYTSNYYGSSINSWNSPYYGYYDRYNSPWYDPYWSQNGWSSSFSFYYGSSWNYGWGGNYNYWNRPYYGNSYYGNSYYGNYYGSNAYWNYYRNPSVIIINNNEGTGRGVAYGKRPTRGSSMISENGSRSRSSMNSGRSEISNGRVKSEYYNRTWRNSNNNSAPSTFDNRTNTQQNRPNNNSWNNNNQQNNNSSFERSSTPSRSTFGDGGGTRTHTGGSSSGSNGRTRGRD